MKDWETSSNEPRQWQVRLEFTLLLAVTLAAMTTIGVVIASPATAHSGGLAADGCHNDRKNGGRHCHRGSSFSVKTAPERNGVLEVYFPNCAAARAAGAAPVRRGQPGYGSHLDRDNDGVGCE